jgi:hypothetical protein
VTGVHGLFATHPGEALAIAAACATGLAVGVVLQETGGHGAPAALASCLLAALKHWSLSSAEQSAVLAVALGAALAWRALKRRARGASEAG